MKRNLEGTADAGSTAFTRHVWHITHGHRRNVFKTLKPVIAAVALQDLIPAAVFEEFLKE